MLLATGRLPDLESLNVRAANIATKDGYVVTDMHMRTSADNIWALGDVTNPVQLKHTANAEAKVFQTIFYNDLKKVELDPIPHAIFQIRKLLQWATRNKRLKPTGLSMWLQLKSMGMLPMAGQ